MFSFATNQSRCYLYLSFCLSPVFSTKPTDIQISLGQSVIHFKGKLLENGSNGKELQGCMPVKAGRAGIMWREGLNNESVSENPRLAPVIDERFITAC